MKKINKMFLSIALILVLAMPMLAGCTLFGNGGAKYSLNLSASNSSYGKVYGQGYYSENEEITIFAIANDGYIFSRWNDGNSENPRTIKLTENKQLTAMFSPKNKMAVVESAKICLSGYWSAQSVYCGDWSLNINNYFGDYGSSGSLKDSNGLHEICGCRRDFPYQNGQYYVENKLNFGVSMKNKISLTLSLTIDGTFYSYETLNMISDVIITKSDNKITQTFQYPNFGTIDLTIVYFVE